MRKHFRLQFVNRPPLTDIGPNDIIIIVVPECINLPQIHVPKIIK